MSHLNFTIPQLKTELTKANVRLPTKALKGKDAWIEFYETKVLKLLPPLDSVSDTKSTPTTPSTSPRVSRSVSRSVDSSPVSPKEPSFELPLADKKRKILPIPSQEEVSPKKVITFIMDFVEYPETWKSDKEFNVTTLESDSKDFKDISDRVATTHTCKIVKIERIENKVLWRQYYINRHTMTNPETKFLFHGTSSTEPKVIYGMSIGFDMRYSARGMWGPGIYFAVNASYSFPSYKYTIPNSSQMQVFYSEVLIGDTIQKSPDSNIRNPGYKPVEEGKYEIAKEYDSIQGTTGGSDVYILYRNHFAYPTYLITFE